MKSYHIVIICLSFFVSSCSTTRLPICPKMAQMSYDTIDEGKGQVFGRFLVEQMKQRGITAKPLNYFVADFTGPANQICWLRRNYPLLICSVNPKLVNNPTDLANAERLCMLNARVWMNLVDSGRVSDLTIALSTNSYCPTCNADVPW